MTEARTSDSELIASKIRVPEARAGFTERSRLLEPLVGGAGPIVIVEAPSGYGKSTLLQQWAAREHRPVAFVRLDRAESDPVLFWRYVVAALKTVEPGLVADADRELQGGMPLVDDVVVPRLLNALDRYDSPCVFMLDDFHRIEGSSVPASLGVFLQHVPASLTVAIATRPEPRLALAGLRAHGLVHDIETRELSFTIEETEAVVSGIDATRSKRDIRTIYTRTEGWATGVYLASRPGTPLPPKGSPQGIHHYLVSEMLDEFRVEDRDFMRMTSIFVELDPDLCDAVTQQGDSGERLRRLSGSNLLLVPFGSTGSYRYHHLLQDVLQSELRVTSGRDAISALHERAFRWYLKHAHLSEAIEHAIEAGATRDAVELVCRSWYDFILGGRLSTTHEWFSWFEEADFSTYPPLAVAGALVSAFAGDARDVERLYRLATRLDYDGDPMDGSTTFEASIAIMSALIGLDGPTAAARHSERALEIEPDSSPWRPTVLAILGVTRIMEVDDRSLDDMVIQAAETQTGPHGLATYALGSLALIYSWRGRWGTAEMYANEAIRLIEELRIGDLVTSGLPYAVCAVISARKGDRERARNLIAVAERPLRRRGDGFPFDSMLLNLTLAEALLELGRPPAAMAQLERAQQTLAKLGDGGRAEHRLNRLVREADRLLRQDADADADTPATLLTARELQVLGLFRTGLTLEQIGERLFVSRDTVKSHASKSYRKLGVHGRDEAVTEAERLGIL